MNPLQYRISQESSNLDSTHSVFGKLMCMAFLGCSGVDSEVSSGFEPRPSVSPLFLGRNHAYIWDLGLGLKPKFPATSTLSEPK